MMGSVSNRCHKPKGYIMATITISETPIERATRNSGRPKRANDFLPLIAQFDDGKTRTVKGDGVEKLSTVLGDLRAAAATIDRSVTVRFYGHDGAIATDPKTAPIMKFLLCAKITRPRKPVEEVVAEVAAEVAEEVVKGKHK